MTGYVQELFFFHELFQFFHTVLFSRIITLLLLHEIFDFFSIRAKLNHSLVRLTHGLKRRLHTRIQTGDLYITWLKSYNLTNLQLHAELLSKKNIYKFTVSYKPSQSELSSDINVGGYQRTTFMIGRVFFLLTPHPSPPPPPPSECIWLLGVFVQVFWQSALLTVLKTQRFTILVSLDLLSSSGGLPYQKDGVRVIPFRKL